MAFLFRFHNAFSRLFSVRNEQEESQSDSHSTEEKFRPLYPGHIETNFVQKLFLTIGSAGMSIVNPARDDMIAVLGETTGERALRKMYNTMSLDPEGAEVLRDRPRINSNTLDYQYLRSLPEGTLAAEYLRFLDVNGVTPDSRLPVQFVDDPDLAYVMQRYREGHDLFHAILGMPTNMLGEVAVKWIEAIQTGLPMCAMGAVFGPVRLAKMQRKKYLASVLPWAIRCGYQSKFLMNVYFEKHWGETMESLRRRLNILPPPLDVHTKKQVYVKNE